MESNLLLPVGWGPQAASPSTLALQVLDSSPDGGGGGKGDRGFYFVSQFGSSVRSLGQGRQEARDGKTLKSCCGAQIPKQG